jgi:hypothetical protein
MKKLTLALLATAALSYPSFAQQSGTQQNPASQPADQQQHWNQSQSGPSMNQGQAFDAGQNNQGFGQTEDMDQQVMSGEDLSKDEVRIIQQTLNRRGFDAGNVDGIWGSETKQALSNFQELQGFEDTGELDRQTLSALGLDNLTQTAGAAAGTDSNTGQAGADMNTGQAGSDVNTGSAGTDVNTGQSGTSANTGQSGSTMPNHPASSATTDTGTSAAPNPAR